ncbi:hypothetical protein GCM10023329_01490 [Streptomyces sanyensis]|uniref:Uncharacterized protein n=1 Tax=Streptomyces sanyensis TaxID=568869 RepID=A0ABP8ZM67_9ACTN
MLLGAGASCPRGGGGRTLRPVTAAGAVTGRRSAGSLVLPWSAGDAGAPGGAGLRGTGAQRPVKREAVDGAAGPYRIRSGCDLVRRS